MKKQAARLVAVSIAVISAVLFQSPVLAQKDKKPQGPPPVNIKRTVARHEAHRLPYGGSVTVIGAPIGSIVIEGWDRSEIDIVADVEWQGPTEADLDLLAAVNNFVVEVDSNHVRIITAGTHDKKYMKPIAKKFPKTLLGLPWKIDFRIKVPALTDVEIDSGIGPIKSERGRRANSPERAAKRR